MPRPHSSLLALALLALVLPEGVAAQEPLTLTQAVERAATLGPAAQAAAGTRAVIVGRARADAQFANPMLEIRRENEGAPIPYDDFITLTLPVSVSGRRFALRDALAAARTRADADSLAVIRGAQHGAARAWWEAWVAGEQLRAARAQSARFSELARFDSLRAAEGAVAEAAALRTRLEADRAAYAAATAVAHEARSRGSLAALLGLDDPAALVLGAPDFAVATASLPGDAAAMDEALASRPDVLAARAAAEEAERRRVAERRNTLPDVGLSGGYKGTGGYSTAQFGVILTPPLLNANGGARERAFGEWLLADADRRATELRARADVRAALIAARAMDDALGGLDATRLAQADEVAAAAEASYREGAATLTETLEALRAVTDLRLATLRALADRALVRLDLRRALGAPPVEMP